MRPTVTTYGKVRGQIQDGVAASSAFPMRPARPEPLRFQAPAPPESWEGIQGRHDVRPDAAQT